MPLFHGSRDASFVHHINVELIVDIIDTEVALYKLSLEDTKTNVYNESDKKVYHTPIKISALIDRQPQGYEGNEFGQDYTQQCRFGFVREYLKRFEVYVEVGDVIEFNGEWWEVDAIEEAEYFGGKNPDYAFSGDKWGFYVSIIAVSHLTRRSRVHVEEVRTGLTNNDNDIPSNI